MMATANLAATADWQTENQHYLMASLDRIRRLLHQQIASQQRSPATTEPHAMRTANAAASAPTASSPTASATAAFSQLYQTFGLSAFEQDVLLLCAGVELDPTIAALCAQAQPEVKHGLPTFNLAGAMFANRHWLAFTPDAPLRRWQLIEVGTGSTLMTSGLRIDERILHQFMGISQLDDRLFGLFKPAPQPNFLVASHQTLVAEIVAAWGQEAAGNPLPLIQLCGSDTASKQTIAAAACQQLDRSLYTLSCNAIPTSAAELHPLLRLWEREARLCHAALLLEWDISHEDTARDWAIALLVEWVTSPLLVVSRDRRSFPQRPAVTLDVNHPTSSEQLALWQHALGDRATDGNGFVERLVSQFNLSTTAIQAASLQALGAEPNKENIALSLPADVKQFPRWGSRLWSICRVQARPQLDDLAQRIDPGESWDDLVLPDQQKDILREIAAHVRQRSKVYEQWGFAKKGGRGLGISALFSGVSGTGKTMAAGVLAQELRLDVYRIDLSSVVSKYIGETEKNLRRVFDAAEAGGVVLLFDEADSLFGKRSEVKDSHDRYANMEVSYLLQRMEAYGGLAILTTNLKEAIDPAFMRRIRFIVRFPFPEYGDRVKIWERIFPSSTPTHGLNPKKLAKLNIAGGNIRNIAMNAAFLAADANQPVQMTHLLRAAQSEYLKLERSMSEAEVSGWVQEK
jgi:hypothetical protein